MILPIKKWYRDTEQQNDMVNVCAWNDVSIMLYIYIYRGGKSNVELLIWTTITWTTY